MFPPPGGFMNLPANFMGQFGLGVVTGARAFNVDALGRLTGLFFRQPWRADANNMARCRRRYKDYPRLGSSMSADYDDSTDLVPDCDTQHMIECQSRCGFYGYYEGSNDYNPPKDPHRERVSGVIWGWGHCLIGTKGFRVSRARIIALVENPEIPNWDSVCENYAGIPLFRTFEDMVAEFPPDPGPIGDQSRLGGDTA